MDIRDTAATIRSIIKNNEPRNSLYRQIDAAVETKFEPSAALKELPFVKNRHYALTDIADARNAGVRTFAVLMPTIEVSPNNDNEYEYDRVERIEQFLSWEFQKMNRVNRNTVHSQIIESAINYHAVALQTQYLPYHYKGKKKTNKIKAALRQKNFNWVVHHPGTVHVDYAKDDSVNGVAKVSEYTLQQLVDRFGKENPGIIKLLKTVDRKSKETFLHTKYKLVDWTDWEKRQMWVVQGEVDESDYVVMDEDHNLPFIPWVVVDKGNPLWQSVIESGMWDNAQHMNIIRFAKSIEQASAPSMVVQSPDGTLKGVWIDPTNPSNPMTVAAGTTVRELQRPQIDPQLETHFQEMRAAIQKSTVSQVLTDIGQYSDAPFSTVNQIVQMALGQLAPAKQVAEDAEAQAFYQMFEWIEHSNMPLVTYRMEDKSSETGNKKRGEEIGIFPGKQPKPEDGMTPEEAKAFTKRVYFDLDALYIKVAMKSQNTADEQARQNVVINALTHQGASKEWGWEQMGYENYQLVEEQRATEMLSEAEVQKVIAMKQLEVQKAQMQMQMEAQQAAQQAQQPQSQSQSDLNAGNAMSTVQGNDMRAGGNPAAMTAPGMTRETMTGEDSIGAEL